MASLADRDETTFSPDEAADIHTALDRLEPPQRDLLCFAVELFRSRGRRPASLDATLERAQDILFTSHARRTVAALRRERDLLRKLDIDSPSLALIHLDYGAADHEQGAKTLDFSPASIRDRQAALRVLLGRDDQVLEVETATGGETLVFPGWSDENDKNRDKKRDVQAIRGFATAIGDSALTDQSKTWAPKSLVGMKLVDAAGRNWNIVDNDATTVRVAPEERLSFALVPRSRAAYVIDDARFATAELIMANAQEGATIIQEEIAKRPYTEWVERFRTLDGQWAPVQNSLEIGHDPQLRANGYIAKGTDADGAERELVANPVQFDETPAAVGPAPDHGEHTDEVLLELGLTYDEIIEHKISGAVL